MKPEACRLAHDAAASAQTAVERDSASIDSLSAGPGSIS
jgi:hypothetical protein